MTVLYTVFDKFEDNEDMKAMRTLEWGIALASNKAEVMTQCTTQYFDVLIFDTRIAKFEWKDTIKEIRNKQIFTPILVITNGETPEKLYDIFDGKAVGPRFAGRCRHVFILSL